MGIFHENKLLVDTCLHMLSSENGDILYLFNEGGILDQPAFELRVLLIVQSAYKNAVQLARKANEPRK